MKIVVTGGAGFIGSALCVHLVRECGDEVLNIDRLTYAANPASLAAIVDDPNYHFLRADVRDLETIRAAIAEFRPDAVIHLAAESHVDRSITGAEVFLQTNFMGTCAMLEASRAYWLTLPEEKRSAFRFLQVSTDEVYGTLGPEGLFSEDTPYDPSSPYSASKAGADHLVTAWWRTYGLPTMISNCSNNYGPRQFPEKLIPHMIINALAGKPLPVYGDGSNVRDWLYVDDHVRALRLIVEKGQPGEKYNVGGRNERTNLQVVRALCALMDEYRPAGGPHERLITFVEDRPGHDRRYAIDASKIERELGWRARENFDSGLRKTVHWYLEHEDWWRPLLNREGYHGQRLGLLEEKPVS